VTSLVQAGYPPIEWLQSFRTPLLDLAAHGASFLGDEPFYLVVLPVLYWAVSRRAALRLALLFLASAWLNAALKGLVDLPRPSPERVATLEPRASGGLPSGHAQNALVFWGYLASLRPRAGVVAGVGVVVLTIGVSRLYLGVHFPADLVVGWVVGGVVLAAFLRWEDEWARRLAAWPAWGLLALAVAGPAVFLLLYRAHEALPAAATLLGAGVGAVWERRRLGFVVAGPLTHLAARLVVGLAVAVGIWAGLAGPMAPLGEGGRILRYALLGFWLTGGAPWVFMRLGWARSSIRMPPPAARSRPR
jgi:membrane-associated phospholipid phosphatase